MQAPIQKIFFDISKLKKKDLELIDIEFDLKTIVKETGFREHKTQKYG